MKITTTGSLGNVGNPLVKLLVAAGHDVTVISNNDGRKEVIQSSGARAAIGSVIDACFLTEAFSGADAVFTMTPSAMGVTNIIENIAAVGRTYAEAIRMAKVKRVVMLSSIGAHAAEGTGPVKAVYQVEKELNKLPGVGLTILRAGLFYYNFFRDIPVIKSMQLMGNNYGEDDQLPLAHPEDIAAAIATELQSEVHGTAVKYIVSDIAGGKQIAAALGKAIGMPELPWVNIPDEQYTETMLRAGVPPELAALLTEMGQAVRLGTLTNDFFNTGATVTGSIKLGQFAQEFKNRYVKS